MKFDEYLKVIEQKNDEILKVFEESLIDAKLTKKTIKNHIANIATFQNYINYAACDTEDLRTLSEIDIGDLTDFFNHWFPEKCMWASANNVKSITGSLKKFCKVMLDKKQMTKERYEDILYTIKEEKDEWLEACDFEGSDSYW